MISKNDLLVGVLVLIGGLIIYSFAPGGALFQPPPGHTTTHYVGGILAVIFGAVGFALKKKTSQVTWAVAALSIILGLVFILDAPGGPLYGGLAPHGAAMQGIGALTAIVGLVGIVAAAVKK